MFTSKALMFCRKQILLEQLIKAGQKKVIIIFCFLLRYKMR